ncbi:MAG: hypothetical protein HZB23_13975 [Deltaproteobacteria bacterium]|nr:hypothetical protein [Deltaproteobacteria bacterium]
MEEKEDQPVEKTAGSVAKDLFGFIVKLQKPRPHDSTWREKAANISRDISHAASQAGKSLSETHESLAELMDEAGKKLSEYSGELSHINESQRIKDMRGSLSRTYERIYRQLVAVGASPTAMKLRNLKPTNYYRNVFHVFNGVLAVSLYETLLTKHQALVILGSILAVFTSLEISRRFSDKWNDFLVDRVFGLISRPKERFEINASTWYVAALFLMTAIAPKTALEMGILVLAIGDPAASVIGRRYGRLKLWHEKSVAGTTAFFVSSLLSLVVLLSIVDGGLSFSGMITACIVTAAAGAATELFSQTINDNFTIPVVSAGIASFWFF